MQCHKKTASTVREEKFHFGNNISCNLLFANFKHRICSDDYLLAWNLAKILAKLQSRRANNRFVMEKPCNCKEFI